MSESADDLDTGDFDIDAAASQYEEARAGDAPPADDPSDPGEGADDQGEGEPPAGKEANPHGHLSYQEWIDAGKDPDDYVGRNAYQQQHERIVDNRKLEKEVKGLKKTQQQTLEAIGDWQAQESARIRAEIEDRLAQAKEDEDVGAALDAQAELDEHDRKTRAPQQQQNEEIAPIADFREANPVLDRDSESFDPEFNAEVEIAFNGMVRRAVEQKREVTDSMVKRWLNKAYKDAVDIFGEDPSKAAADDEDPPRESQRNQRRGGQQTSRRRGSQKPREARAEDVVIENPRNPRQANAAAEIRDLIGEKYGEDAAKGFEKSITS